jgi:hypothetical protein
VHGTFHEHTIEGSSNSLVLLLSPAGAQWGMGDRGGRWRSVQVEEPLGERGAARLRASTAHSL